MADPDGSSVLTAIVTHLTPTSIPTGLGVKPSGGGWAGQEGASAFQPYVIVWPLSDTHRATLDSYQTDLQPTVQATCVALDPATAAELADRVRALAFPPVTLPAGHTLVDVHPTLRLGPRRDPDDDRLWFCLQQIRFTVDRD